MPITMDYVGVTPVGKWPIGKISKPAMESQDERTELFLMSELFDLRMWHVISTEVDATKYSPPSS